MTVLKTSDILTQWKLYSLFKGPTNPYTIYANEDRFLNAVYRYYTLGNFKSNYNLNHEGADTEDHIPYSFQYEKQTNFLFQHFWAATALLGIGYSINSQDFGSSDKDKYNLAALTTFRSVLAALIATAAYIGNVYRYDPQMLKNNFKPSEKYPNFESYEKEVKNNRGELAVWTSIFLVINGLIGLGIAGKQLDMAINSNADDKDKEEKIKLAGIALGVWGANILTNTLKGFAAYGTLVDAKGITNYAPGTSAGFAIAGSILGMVNATLSIAIFSPLFSRSLLTETQRGVLAGEIVGQIGGGIVQAACNIALAIKLANGVSTGIGVVGPALGAAAAGVVLCLSPLEIYGLVQQSDYASKLDELGKEMAGYGYEGDSMLADLYRAKVAAEGGILAATTTLNLVGAVVSGLAAASVVGMPAAVVVGITMAALSGILKGVQQPILEKIADDFARKIEAQGGAFTFFGKSLDANYKQLVKSKAAVNYLTSIQNGYGVDSVIGVSTVAMSSTARELAAITRNAANAQANKSYIDRFTDGEVTADKNITIDTSKGIINTGGGNEQNKQLLTFLTPLMTPGDEQRGRVSTGKSAYANNLTITGSVKDWMINDGDSSSVMDVSDVATSAIDSDKKIIKNIGIIVNAGAGDDVLIAGAGDTKYDGGTGNNSISYANFGGNSGIDVQITDYGFKVVKNLKDVQTYQESIKSETVSYGKRTETVQYREFTLATQNLNTVDQLYNVSNITGTGGNDTIRGNDKANLIAGGLGADQLFGNEGDDRFMQNINLENDVIDGGSDNDTVDYGGYKFDGSQRKVRGEKGVLADLSVGKIYKFKYQNGRDDIYDKVTNIENVFGSSLNDTLIGDAENNILSGGEGNDTISGGDGQDILFGGIGNDSLSGGAGNDQFAQNIDLESDALDGGDGTDTVNYEGLNEFANGKRDKMDSQGVWADLSIGKIYKYKGYKDDVFDTVRNIENVVGTTLNDTLKGNNQDNVLSGGVGNDALFGDTGNDTLIGGAGTDTLDGGDGDDWILQDLEISVSDMLEGGAGNDVVDYSAAALKEENLILNADFDKALTAADSDYKVNPTGDKQGGQVYVLKNAKDWDVNTPQGLDGANDQFLAVNGGSDASQLFWKQDVTVVSG
ncbi:MAG: bifunctional hemolysin-adenylate cyclase, partial [Pseudomonadota bacterium]